MTASGSHRTQSNQNTDYGQVSHGFRSRCCFCGYFVKDFGIFILSAAKASLEYHPSVIQNVAGTDPADRDKLLYHQEFSSVTQNPTRYSNLYLEGFLPSE
jgi:hypothetical protein